MTIEELKARSVELMANAKANGNSDQIYFATTFASYVGQIELMQKLKEEYERDGVVITKQYVKGADVKVIHPAVKEYDIVVAGANKTISVLLRIANNNKTLMTDIDPLSEFLA